MIIRFLKSLNRLLPCIRVLIPFWDLNLVLSLWKGSPFEPMARCFLSHISLKVSFLAAITLARWVIELQALMADPSYMVFHRDKVGFPPHPKFLFIHWILIWIRLYISQPSFQNPNLTKVSKNFILQTSAGHWCFTSTGLRDLVLCYWYPLQIRWKENLLLLIDYLPGSLQHSFVLWQY